MQNVNASMHLGLVVVCLLEEKEKKHTHVVDKIAVTGSFFFFIMKINDRLFIGYIKQSCEKHLIFAFSLQHKRRFRITSGVFFLFAI